MESIGEDHNVVPLSEGDACGEELLTWCLEHSSVNKGKIAAGALFSLDCLCTCILCYII